MIPSKIEVLTKTTEVIPKILGLMDVFTLGKILIAAFLILASVAFFTLWTERTVIVNQILDTYSPKMQKWEISNRTEKTIQDEINLHQQAAWAIITEMDLGSNTQRNKFWYDEDQLIHRAASPEILGRSSSQIFNFNKLHTEQMVKILQNEFECSALVDTSFNTHAYSLINQTENICRIAIPPFYGRFVGILTIGVRGPVTDEIKFSIKAMASNIAATVYWGDVIKLP